MNAADRNDTMPGSAVVALFTSFAAAGVKAWVAGGWAVDAVVGRQTRPHGDVDIAVDAVHLPLILDLLSEQGFVTTVDWSPARRELTAPDGRRVDLHPVTFAGDGSGIQAGLDGDSFSYAASGFTTGAVDGHLVPCLSIEQQLQFRKGYEPRPVDRHDVALLEQLRDRS